MSEKPTCRSCGAEILWAVTVKGKRMPLDPEPVANGNVLVEPPQFPNAQPLARTVAPGEGTHQSHFVSCPFAREHRR